MQDNQIQSAYHECLQLAHEHYENFPTASRLVEVRHRQATAAIYSFARRADDIADEGNKSNAHRHAELDEFCQKLDDTFNNKPVNDPTFIALADTIQRYRLPKAPFESLLKAFSMDIDKNRFANFEELLYYCRHSANPVGELVLRLHGIWNDTNGNYSDLICTALQLVNFIQDMNSDFQQRNRIYIPMDEMRKYDVSEEQIRDRHNSKNLKLLVEHQLKRAASMLLSGAPLTRNISGRLKWVIRLTITSALCICVKLSTRDDVFQRPLLTRADWLKIALKSLYFRPDRTHVKILANLRNKTLTG